MDVLVGRGEVELMVTEDSNGLFSFDFSPEHDRRRWLEAGCIPVQYSEMQDYVAELPPCDGCFHCKLCHDMAADDCDTEEEILAVLEDARINECVAVDTDLLRQRCEQFASPDDLREFLYGGPTD